MNCKRCREFLFRPANKAIAHRGFCPSCEEWTGSSNSVRHARSFDVRCPNCDGLSVCGVGFDGERFDGEAFCPRCCDWLLFRANAAEAAIETECTGKRYVTNVWEES